MVDNDRKIMWEGKKLRKTEEQEDEKWSTKKEENYKNCFFALIKIFLFHFFSFSC